MYLDDKKGIRRIQWVCDGCLQQIDKDMNVSSEIQPEETTDMLSQPMMNLSICQQTTQASPVRDINASFDIHDISFATPVDIREDSIVADDLDTSLPTDGQDQLTFTVVEQGSKQCRPKLVDSLGYVYTVKQS